MTSTYEGLIRPDEAQAYFKNKLDNYDAVIRNRTENLMRLEAQRNELNAQGKALA